jgi:putative heme-binding domain-containing protein
LLPLLDQPPLRGAAIRALAVYDDPATPSALVRAYPRLSESEKEDAVATLSSRSTYAMALLESVRSGVIPRRDLSVTIARQIQSMSDPKVKAALAEVWGTIRPTSGEKAPLMAKYKTILTSDRLKAADLSKGRSVFQRNCVSCHKLFDEGASLGPELTGSDRANLDYVLENVLDPSASVPAEYRVSTVATNDGRVLSGMIQQQDDKTLVVRTTNDRVVLAREDVAELKASNQSMMPEGLFERLSDDEVRDLVAYLATKVQVPPALPNP